jgi:hypothetical protein
MLLAVAVAALTPVAVVSLARYLTSRLRTESVYRTTPALNVPVNPGRASYALLHAQILKLDELSRVVTLRITGNHICNACGEQMRVVFFSLPPVGVLRAGKPPSAAVLLPPSSEQVTTDISLPVEGDLLIYPFDRYRLRIGLVLQTIATGADPAAPVDVAPDAAAERLFLTLEEVVPQVDISRLVALKPGEAGLTGDAIQGVAPAYMGVVVMGFERPAYLKVLVVLVVVLVASGAFYATWMNTLGELLTKTGALILGIWGVRSLLLSPYPPHSTAVDALLTLVIFFVLAAVLIRVLYQLHDSAGLSVLPRTRHSGPGSASAPAPAGGPPAPAPAPPPAPAAPGRRRPVRRLRPRPAETVPGRSPGATASPV